MINTIGPVWDGNEVWLLVAGGATFAAFPVWYATLFSGFYLALLLLLVALIIRGVAFEYRGKSTTRPGGAAGTSPSSSARRCPRCCGASRSPTSCAACRSTRSSEFTGTFSPCSTRTALLGGLTTLTLFALHGALFLALKTDGEIRRRARGFAARIGLVATVCGAVVPAVDPAVHRPSADLAALVVAAVALVGALGANARGREGWAFAATATADRRAVATLFGALYPDVMPSTTAAAYSLTTTNASSTPLHAGDHDLGRRRLHAARAGLPGLDLLGLPPPDRGRPPAAVRRAARSHGRRQARPAGRRVATGEAARPAAAALRRGSPALPRRDRGPRGGSPPGWSSPRPRCWPTPSPRPSCTAPTWPGSPDLARSRRGRRGAGRRVRRPGGAGPVHVRPGPGPAAKPLAATRSSSSDRRWLAGQRRRISRCWPPGARVLDGYFAALPAPARARRADPRRRPGLPPAGRPGGLRHRPGHGAARAGVHGPGRPDHPGAHPTGSGPACSGSATTSWTWSAACRR